MEVRWGFVAEGGCGVGLDIVEVVLVDVLVRRYELDASGKMHLVCQRLLHGHGDMLEEHVIIWLKVEEHDNGE